MLHFHTQYNAEIPWATMDMDFMNLNQSAHGDREFGHICAPPAQAPQGRFPATGRTRSHSSRLPSGHVLQAAWADAHDMRILRFGDQMNNVAGPTATR
jgi:L-arabinose isomerase